jgi:alcohol dehydrogenase (NADP+)
MAEAHTLSCFCYDPATEAYTTRSTQKELGDHDVLINTTHSGVCYTDVHAKASGCGLGHEGVGIVQHVGSRVTNLEKGDRAGWGWLHSVGIATCHF